MHVNLAFQFLYSPSYPLMNEQGMPQFHESPHDGNVHVLHWVRHLSILDLLPTIPAIWKKLGKINRHLAKFGINDSQFVSQI